MNLPTKITLSRIIAAPVMAVVFYLPFAQSRLVAAIIFVLAALTDMLDGRLARRRSEVTDMGKFLDPVADKVLAVFAMFAVTEAALTYNPYGVIVAAVIVARELLVGVFRTVAMGRGVVIAADKFGKLKTVFLNVSLPLVMISEYHVAIKIVGNVLYFVGGALAVVSGINYVINGKKAMKEQSKNG